MRTRPGPHDDLTASAIVVTGSVMNSIVSPNTAYDPFSSAIASSSVLIEGSISKGRGYERRKLNAILLGQPASQIGRTPYPSPGVMDSNLTGTFESPSWTHASIGSNQAFVGMALTSSDYENVAFNTYVSGIDVLESSAVPATQITHYSKEQRFQTITVKKSASFFDTVPNQFNSSSFGGRYAPPLSFVPGSGSLVSQINNPGGAPFNTGSNGIHPAAITLDVPVSGKLVDIRVWVELHHESSSVNLKYTPLGSLSISLRSPNLSWGWANPIENDDFLDSAGGSQSQFELWHNSFLLWNGPGTVASLLSYENFTVLVEPTIFEGIGTGTSNGNAKWHSMFAGWDRDLGMRTVFGDGASTQNPRVNYSSNLSGNFVGAPNSNLGINSAWGLGVTWTGSTGSPPRGWLTGPGGTANVNEWPTTGVNNGADFMRPVYPLLDPILQTIPTVPGVNYPATIVDKNSFLRNTNFTSFVGLRPGLRGTEISGTWLLMFAAGPDNTPQSTFPLWFRQARLEITYETGMTGERIRRRTPPVSPRDMLLYSVSGVIGSSFTTASWNTSMTIPGQNSIARTFGVTPNSGVVDVSKALRYRLTGSLADLVGTTPGWLFTGPFGMPVIPESSASLVSTTQQTVVSRPFSDFLQPRRDLDTSQRLIDVAADTKPQVSLRDLAIAFVSASAT